MGLFNTNARRLGGAGLIAACFLTFSAGLCARAAGQDLLAVLFLENRDPAASPLVEPPYAEDLASAGIQYAEADAAAPLQADFIRRFNVFVIGNLPIDNAENDVFGWRMIGHKQTLNRILAAVNEGAGLLVYADINDGAGLKVPGWNQVMRPLGATIRQACILSTNFTSTTWSGNGPAWYAWTENLAKHPVTEGLRRLYYPTACLRWDDAYTAPPLDVDCAWTPLVRAMPGACIGRMEKAEWLCAPPAPEPPVWAAVRTLGKGRVAVIAMPPLYTHALGQYPVRTPPGWYGESCVGPVNGIVLEKGDGIIPSDTGRLLLNLYRWLGAPAADAGMGGHKTGQPVATESGPFAAIFANPSLKMDWDKQPPLRSWGHVTVFSTYKGKPFGMEVNDPRVTDDMRFYRALVGAHSSLSDGSNTVAELAASARAAGYSLVCFTETFAAMDARKWDALVSQCRSNSAPDLFLLPGLDVEDFAGNRYLYVNPGFFPRPTWLTPDGKRLQKVQMTNPLAFGNGLTIAHRVHGTPLPNERLKHFNGLSIATYRGATLQDDSRKEFVWHVANADMPIPIAVHEVFSTQEVAAAARAGFQQILPANTLADGVDYFRSGIIHYFKHPGRHMISEGPIVEQWVLDPDGATSEDGEGTREQFRVWIRVRAEAPLATVTLYDGVTPVRRWLPGTNVFAATADFQHAQQRHLYLEAQDTAGRKVITSAVRTCLPRYVFRCPDRQNWIGHVGILYTGTKLSEQADLVMPIQGTEEGNGLLPDSPGHCMAAKLQFPFISREVTLTEVILDEKYTAATFKDVGFDARPTFPSEPSSVYQARFRRWNFTGFTPEAPYPTLLDYDIELKRDVEPRKPGGLFPAFAPLRSPTNAWFDETGIVQVSTQATGVLWDIPAGALAGGYIPLSDGLRTDRNWIGLKPPAFADGRAPAHTRFTARLLLTGNQFQTRPLSTRFDENPAAWLKALGVRGAPSFALTFTRGKLERLSFLAETTADGGVVSGLVATNSPDIPYRLPMPVRGVNERWPAAIWRPEDGIRYVGVFEGRAWPLLDVRRAGPFIAGNLVVADRPEIVFSIVTWAKDRLRLDVHNPTDAPIVTRLHTPVPIPGYTVFDRQVTIPAGTSLFVE